MRRSISLLLVLALAVLLLAGCASSSPMPLIPWPDETHDDVPATEATDAPTDPGTPVLPTESDDPAATQDSTDVPGGDVQSGELTFTKDPNALSDRSDVRYMLVYNPDFAQDNEIRYNDTWIVPTRSTGNISTQIDVDIDRAGELEEKTFEFGWVSQGEIGEVDLGKMHFESDRAGGLPPVYQVGDTHRFYTDNARFTDRTLDTYTCVYAGEHCYVWLDQNTTAPEDLLVRLGQGFDKDIYDMDVRLFGEGRFLEDGGKVNFLFYDIERNYMGYFCGVDNFYEDEWDPADAALCKPNCGHAIIYVNAKCARDPAYESSLYSTFAHEFQHQICHTSGITSYLSGHGAYADSWFNEAMSGFVEEYMYPGIQEYDGRYQALHSSETLRTGQSMYNFDISQGIGAYGSVFLFAEYLANLAGDDVFHNFHDYWRYSGSPTLNTAEAIYNAVGEDVRAKISAKYA